MSLATIFAEVKTLSLEDQRALNSLLVANIRTALKQKAIMCAVKFKGGDVVKFDGKTRGPIFIKIHSFSRDATKVKGVQLNRGWKTKAGTMWTVAASVVQAASVEEAEKF